MKIAATVATLVMFSSIAAQAATVDQISGDVFERQGSGGFRKISRPSEAQPGDTVMASGNGSAQIVLDDGRVIRLEPGQTVIIPEPGSSAGPSIIEYAVIAAAAGAVGTGIYFGIKNEQPVSP